MKSPIKAVRNLAKKTILTIQGEEKKLDDLKMINEWKEIRDTIFKKATRKTQIIREMEKIDIDDTVTNNITRVSKALNKRLSEITLIVQDRDRHKDIIDEARAIGARIKLFSDGDVASAMATCFEETGIDIFMGIGGAPEGVITAAAVKCMGGDMQAKLNPLSEEEISRCHEMGFTDENLSKVLYLDDLAKGEDVFFAATGITSGDLLKGVVYLKNDKAKTHSIVMRSKTGTIRFVEAIHKLDKNSIMVDLMDKYKNI